MIIAIVAPSVTSLGVCLLRIILVKPTKKAMQSQIIPIFIFKVQNKAATKILKAVCIELLIYRLLICNSKSRIKTKSKEKSRVLFST